MPGIVSLRLRRHVVGPSRPLARPAGHASAPIALSSLPHRAEAPWIWSAPPLRELSACQPLPLLLSTASTLKNGSATSVLEGSDRGTIGLPHWKDPRPSDAQFDRDCQAGSDERHDRAMPRRACDGALFGKPAMAVLHTKAEHPHVGAHRNSKRLA